MNAKLPQTLRPVPHIIINGLLLCSVTLRGAEYQGAGPLLRKVAEQSALKEEAKEPADENARLRKDLDDFRKKVGSLPPAEAAKGWLDLVDRRAKLSPESLRDNGRFSMPVRAQELIAALPPPAAWTELRKAVESRPAARGREEIRDIGLRLLVSTLTRDTAARAKEIVALQAKAEKADERSVYFFRNMLEQIGQAMLATLDDPEAVLKSLERELASPSEYGNNLRVPNLVSLVGAQKAEDFLRRALQKENVTLSIDEGNATSKLAQKLALELIDKLKKPQWDLVNSLESVELYEALEKRFDEQKKPAAQATPELPGLPDVSSLPGMSGDYNKRQAQVYYLLGLISKDRAKDAVEVAKQIGKQDSVYVPEHALKAMERAGYTRALDGFFYELLSQDPGLPFWKDYVALAAKAGQTERMVKLARTSAAREDLSKAKRGMIHDMLFRALLAAEQVDEGVAELRRLMNSPEKPARDDYRESPGQLGLMLARLGLLLKKTEWTEEGLQAARKAIEEAKNRSNPYSWETDSLAASVANILLELDRGAEAETMFAEALARAARQGTEESNDYGSQRSGTARGLLEELAAFYHKVGRHGDVVTLLDQAPYWGVKDVTGLDGNVAGLRSMPQVFRMRSTSGSPMPYIAASSLAATGRKDDARKIVNALLDDQPGSDRAYELLLELGGDSVVARLDELFARDQFEERPLIWKAELLRRQKKFEEAEKVARQAISIDPSDGEQGHGDRLRAYAVLGEIRAARGDQKEADFLRGAIKAIRLAEEADKYYAAGLLKRAIEMYEESLKLFADAYCIQSRLAIQLAELGRHEEAEAHYRRAYELMPDSFGRVESHCFGCERAFDGQRAQTLAEKIFTEFAAKQPNKPQVHYLLGYLRQEQGKAAEAMQHFQTAVKLDAEYLNAWQKIQSLAHEVRLPAKEHDQVVFNILRLDPLRRHAHVSFERVTDLAGLWEAIQNGESRRPAAQTALYPLAASKAAIEKDESGPKTRQQQQRQRMLEMRMEREETGNSPAQAIAQTPFVRVAAEMVAGDQLAHIEE